MKYLHPVMQAALAPFAPPPPLTQEQCKAVDAAMHQDKLVDGYGQRQFQSALALERQHNPETWRAA